MPRLREPRSARRRDAPLSLPPYFAVFAFCKYGCEVGAGGERHGKEGFYVHDPEHSEEGGEQSREGQGYEQDGEEFARAGGEQTAEQESEQREWQGEQADNDGFARALHPAEPPREGYAAHRRGDGEGDARGCGDGVDADDRGEQEYAGYGAHQPAHAAEKGDLFHAEGVEDGRGDLGKGEGEDHRRARRDEFARARVPEEEYPEFGAERGVDGEKRRSHDRREEQRHLEFAAYLGVFAFGGEFGNVRGEHHGQGAYHGDGRHDERERHPRHSAVLGGGEGCVHAARDRAGRSR